MSADGIRIHAGLLVPGRGTPLPDMVIDVRDRRIAHVGPAADTGIEAGRPVDLRVPVLMPGMWDCHTHLVGVRGLVGVLEGSLTTPPALAAARAVRDLRSALDAGVTSVRDLGGLGLDLAVAVEEGSVAGPTIYAAGALLSQTGGHGDVHHLPRHWVADGCGRGVLRLADGVSECLRAVREQLRAGAQVIKVCASGGVLSELDHPEHQQFSDAELRAIVDEEGRAERVVAAHCHGKAGIMAALRAGCHTIEHGTFLDEEAAVAMRESGAVLVTTCTIIEGMLAGRDRLPPQTARKLDEISDQHRGAILLARDAGVTIAAGTDLGVSAPGTPLSWGCNGAEAGHLVAAGLSPLAAIEACTVNGPGTLGRRAPATGLVAAGYDADLLALDADPVRDARVLADPCRVTHVWKRGVPVKWPGPMSDRGTPYDTFR